MGRVCAVQWTDMSSEETLDAEAIHYTFSVTLLSYEKVSPAVEDLYWIVD